MAFCMDSLSSTPSSYGRPKSNDPKIERFNTSSIDATSGIVATTAQCRDFAQNQATSQVAKRQSLWLGGVEDSNRSAGSCESQEEDKSDIEEYTATLRPRARSFVLG